MFVAKCASTWASSVFRLVCSIHSCHMNQFDSFCVSKLKTSFNRFNSFYICNHQVIKPLGQVLPRFFQSELSSCRTKHLARNVRQVWHEIHEQYCQQPSKSSKIMAIHGIYYHVIHVLTYAAALECGCLEPQPMGPVRVPDWFWSTKHHKALRYGSTWPTQIFHNIPVSCWRYWRVPSDLSDLTNISHHISIYLIFSAQWNCSVKLSWLQRSGSLLTDHWW